MFTKPLISQAPLALGTCLWLVCGCSGNPHGDELVDAGAKLFRQAKYREAVARLEQALGKPLRTYDQATVNTMIGNCYQELEEYDRAIEYHERAIQLDPANHEAYVNKGVVFRLIGEFDAAEECYEKAIELEPDYPEAYASLGALAIFQDDPERAIEVLEKAIQLDPTLAVSHANLAIAYAAVGRFDEADQALKRAILRGYDKSELIQKRIEDLRRIGK